MLSKLHIDGTKFLQIANLNAQREGRPQVTCVDMVKVFEELEKQAQIGKNDISEGM